MSFEAREAWPIGGIHRIENLVCVRKQLPFGRFCFEPRREKRLELRLARRAEGNIRVTNGFGAVCGERQWQAKISRKRPVAVDG